MVKERKQVSLEDRWNVEALYQTPGEWQKDFFKIAGENKKPRWPQIAAFKGRIQKDPKKLGSLLDLFFQLERQLSKLYTYAHLCHDEDLGENAPKEMFARISSLFHDFRQETSWIEPEILQGSEEDLESLLQAEDLKVYRIYLEKIIRLRDHTLSADKEELIALAGKALETSYRAFNVFNNADLKFSQVLDGRGQTHELTHAKYLFYLRQSDRVLREAAFKTMHRSFLQYENTLAELINGQIQTHVLQKNVRNYSSSLEASLFPHQIDLSVYHSLIQAVRERLGSLHHYIALRRKSLNIPKLHAFDLYVPLVSEVDFSMDYKTAEELIVESVAILGKDYQSDLKKGLGVERWVDKYENARKRSGAYSSGCFDSMPYILMNYQGTLNDVLTLSHEAGHSMHTLMSCRHQPYHYSSYPIFVAEVASTFHEALLSKHLLSKLSSDKQKAYIINQKIDDIRSTLFRQTMFAEFELHLHEWAEQGIPLTPEFLKTEYRKLNIEYFGPEFTMDEELDIEWARIPHFYYNFYVYQYATGISAAHALVEKVLKEGAAPRDKYLQFLSSGSSRYPLELLASAGIDMRKKDPIHATIDHFDQLVSHLFSLLES